MSSKDEEPKWTVETLRILLDERAQWQAALAAETDRRYAEVALEREKALKIKETADERALGLQAETQKYKDEKANQLREQINSERGLYATKDDVIAAVDKVMAHVTPMTDYVSGKRGNDAGRSDMRLNVNMLVGVSGLVLSAVIVLVALWVAP